MKAAITLQRENGVLRALLKEVLDIDPEHSEPATLIELQSRIAGAVTKTDGRVSSGFANSRHQAAAKEQRDARRSTFHEQHGATLRNMQAQGMSFGRIAKTLNDLGIRAPMGGEWKPGSVKFQIDNLPPE